MSQVSPPKPWERVTTNPTSAMTSVGPEPSIDSTAAAPALPDRPNALSSTINQTASNYSAYGANRFTSPYNSPYGTGYGSGYGSAYGMGGLGGYGSYGSYGMGGMGGMGGMYNRPYGMGGMPGPMDPNNPASLTQTWNQSTQATFQIMESIVGAFGGFAQMLESAYMTTHSSFFAMVSMAEQLGNLRQTLGSVLGIFALLRWLRTLFAKVTGRPPPADATALTPANFSAFMSGTSAPPTLPDGSPAPPRASKKPFIMFALAVFGLPYLMSKLIRSMAKAQEAEEEKRLAAQGIRLLPDGSQQYDPNKLDFCRVLYDYTPAQQSGGMDLEVKKGDMVAVLSKTDPMGNASQWWQCRTRQGKVGYLPAPYLEIIIRNKPAQPQIAAGAHDNGAVSLPGSRTSTLRGSETGMDRTKSLTSAVSPVVQGGPGDITAESFQKSAFYN